MLSVQVVAPLLSMATDGALMAPLRNPAAPAEDPRREINPGNDGAEMPPEMVRFPDVWLFWKIMVLLTFPVMVMDPELVETLALPPDKSTPFEPDPEANVIPSNTIDPEFELTFGRSKYIPIPLSLPFATLPVTAMLLVFVITVAPP